MTERIVEIVCPTDRTTPAIYLLNTMTREVKRGDLLEHFKIPLVDGQKTVVEVEMKINGVPVNFSESIQDMWDRMFSSYEDDVLRKAKELLSATRFDRLNDLLNVAEWEIEQEVTKLLDDQR